MPLSDIVTINITTESAGVQQAGFGVPLILSANAAFAERVRTYGSLAEMVQQPSPDFAITDPEYLMASALLAQNPRLPEFKVGRLALPPTQRWTIDVAAVVDDTDYVIKFGGNTYTHPSGVAATHDGIIAALEVLIDATPVAGFTASVNTGGGAGFHTLDIVADASANWAQLEVGSAALFSSAQDQVDPGVATDLAAIALEDNEWYCLLGLYNSEPIVEAMADWAGDNDKLCIAATQDTKVITETLAADDDVAAHLANATGGLNNERVALIYHPDNGQFADGAWAGRCLPTDPGSITWKFKSLTGVATTSFTTGQKSKLDDKKCNFYYSLGGRGSTSEGWLSAGEYIDVLRGRDWYAARLSERIANLLLDSDKIPFTDPGIALIEAEVHAQNQDGIDVGLIAQDPAPTVTVPRAADVSAADKSVRLLRNVEFTFTLAGAVHKVEINGVISV